MDVFPTFLNPGASLSGYELDGLDVLPMLSEGAPSPHSEVYWEMMRQTAVRRGRWKLVLNAALVEGAEPDEDVLLADPGERENLRHREPRVLDELMAAARSWRERIDARWEREWLPRVTNTTDLETNEIRL